MRDSERRATRADPDHRRAQGCVFGYRNLNARIVVWVRAGGIDTRRQRAVGGGTAVLGLILVLYIGGAHNGGPARNFALDEAAELIRPHVFRGEYLLAQ